MSLQIKASRGGARGYPGAYARAMGDPGLFAAIAGGISAVKTGLKIGKAIFGRKVSRPPPQLSLPLRTQGTFPQAPTVAMPGTGGRTYGPAVVRNGGPGVGGQPSGSSKPIYRVADGGPPGPGYRPNKTGYWRTSPQGTPSWVSPGEIWVKSRRRNAANPRAFDRALGRVMSAKRFAAKANAVSVRSNCPTPRRKAKKSA